MMLAIFLASAVGFAQTAADMAAHNAAAMQYNDIVKVLNTDLRTCMQDLKDAESAPDPATKAAKYAEVEDLMLKDTHIKPDASVLWAQLGKAQVGLKKYAEAEASFNKVLEVESTATRPNPQVQNLANAELAKLHARGGAAGPVPAAQTPYQDVAPPPPPPAPAPTISLGQTKEQVAAAFGEPVRKAVLGPKEIFFYKEMKVTFTNGKVSNVD
jgi:tetratricopeptide (TPR) repeat protein